MAPDEYCQQKGAPAGSSRYYSLLFVPADQRQAVAALYAFARELDDVVDGAIDLDLARTKLDWWRREVTQTRAGTPQHPVMLALAPAVRRYGLPHDGLAELIDGAEMDLAQNRYLDFNALQRYCHRTGVLMVMAAKILGHTDPRTPSSAHQLGVALALTEIIREVGHDARRGRIYLPLDELKRFGVQAKDVLAHRHTDGFRTLIEFSIERAEQLYADALRALPAADRKAQRAGLALVAIQRALLREIKRDGCRVLERRTSLTPLRKFWLAWRTWVVA